MPRRAKRYPFSDNASIASGPRQSADSQRSQEQDTVASHRSSMVYQVCQQFRFRLCVGMRMMTGVVTYLKTLVVQLTDLFPRDIVCLVIEEIEAFSDENVAPKPYRFNKGPT